MQNVKYLAAISEMRAGQFERACAAHGFDPSKVWSNRWTLVLPRDVHDAMSALERANNRLENAMA